MAQLAASRQEEVLITRGAEEADARAAQRKAKEGALVRIAQGVYLHEKAPEGQAQLEPDSGRPCPWSCGFPS